jgi:hypothetical protein
MASQEACITKKRNMKNKNSQNKNVVLQFAETQVPDLSSVDFEPSGDFANGFGAYISEAGNLKFKAAGDDDWRTIAVPDTHYPNIAFKAISKDSTCTVALVGI